MAARLGSCLGRRYFHTRARSTEFLRADRRHISIVDDVAIRFQHQTPNIDSKQIYIRVKQKYDIQLLACTMGRTQMDCHHRDSRI